MYGKIKTTFYVEKPESCISCLRIAEKQTRAVREYLELLDQEAEFNRPQKTVSLTDPNSQWNGSKSPAQLYYLTHYMVDVDENIIMEVEASVSTLSLEAATTKTMLARIEATYG
ncbi:MAG: hypothetical protein ACI9VI_001754 [Candidatus Azotimanducaceae bacterium]